MLFDMSRHEAFDHLRVWGGSGQDRRGTVALELAILAVPLFLLVLGAMEIGYDLYVQVALSNAVHVAARSVQVGTAQGDASGAAEAAWVKSSVCPALGGRLDCGQLYVSISAIPSGTGENYYTYLSANAPSLTTMTSSSDSVCTGSGAQMMILQAYYLSPTFLGLMVPGWSQVSPVNANARVHVTYAASGFVNEYFSGGEAGC
jgi:Flp pilus assembly protein TadG